MSKLFINVTYPINGPNKFEIDTNIKSELVSDIIVKAVYFGIHDLMFLVKMESGKLSCVVASDCMMP